MLHPTVIARSEATKQSSFFATELDCFAFARNDEILDSRLRGNERNY
jgi:hypothetical protein